MKWYGAGQGGVTHSTIFQHDKFDQATVKSEAFISLFLRRLKFTYYTNPDVELVWVPISDDSCQLD